MEIGIFLLLPQTQQGICNQLTEKLKKAFDSSGVIVKGFQNIYHMSLFQMRIKRESLEVLEGELEKICKNFPSIDIQMEDFLTDTQENIFWNVKSFLKNEDKINEIHKEIVERLSLYRSKNLMEQININTLNLDQVKMVERYGVYWGLPGRKFNPHVTVFYNSGIDRKNQDGELIKIQHLIHLKNFTKNETFKAHYIAIGELGYDGNVLNIIKKIKLQDI